MAKPAIQKDVTVTWSNKKNGLVHLVATTEAMEDFGTFLYNVANNRLNDFYTATVDQRYDFDAVIDYIENWSLPA